MKKDSLLKLQIAILTAILFFSNNLVFADNHAPTEKSIAIAYNTPFSYALDNNVSWEINDNNGGLINSGIGNISQTFNTPGSYTIAIHNNNTEEEHSSLPDKINISVSPNKIIFDLSSIQFSQDIVGGQSANGITVSIKANFSSFDNSPVIYNQELSVFGVGSTISGKIKNNPTTLNQGANILVFILDGQATTGNNIQLNFTDFNGEVQPFTLTPKI